MTGSQAFILILATVTIIAWPQITGWFGLDAGGWVLATIVHGVTIPLMVFLSFALALQIGPDTKQRWEWIYPGSLLGTVVVIGVSLIFRFYVQHWATIP